MDNIQQVLEKIGFNEKTTLKEFKEMVTTHEFSNDWGGRAIDRVAYVGQAGWDTVGLVRFNGYFRNEKKSVLVADMYKECLLYLAGNKEETMLDHRQKYSISFNK